MVYLVTFLPLWVEFQSQSGPDLEGAKGVFCKFIVPLHRNVIVVVGCSFVSGICKSDDDILLLAETIGNTKSSLCLTANLNSANRHFYRPLQSRIK